MKIYPFFLVLGLIACIGAFGATALAENPLTIPTATVANGCTPWNGPAVLVSLDLPERSQSLAIMIWNAGIEQLNSGKEVSLGGGGSGGNGHVTLCGVEDNTICARPRVKLTIPAMTPGDHSPELGTVTILPEKEGDRPEIIRFRPIRDDSQAECG